MKNEGYGGGFNDWLQSEFVGRSEMENKMAALLAEVTGKV